MVKALTAVVLLLLPLTFFVLPLPLLDDSAEVRRSLVFLSYELVLAAFVGFLIGRRKSRLKWVVALIAIAAPVISIYGIAGSLEWNLALPVLVLSVGAFFFYLAAQQQIAWSGILGLLLTLGIVSALEYTFRQIPSKTLVKHVRKVPPLAAEDQVNIVYKKNGFRGKRPCLHCPENLIRVVTMGGSSTYGVPMRSGNRTYSAELQRLLDERRPQEHYEVLNGGVAAFGIMQVISALREEILQYKPDIVSVCSWFNDTSFDPRWYRIPGLSDRDGYHKHRFLRKLENFPIYKQIRQTKSFAFLRHYLVTGRQEALGRKDVRKKSRRPRMTPEEFQWGLEEVVRLGKEHDFMPVFVIEPLNRSGPFGRVIKANDYLQVMKRVAGEHGVLLVDTATPIHEQTDSWLFYDFIHPNVAGHQLVAESIYQALFTEQQTKQSKVFWQSREVDLDLPHRVQRKPQIQLVRDEIRDKTIRIKARAPFLSKGSATLVASIDRKPVKRFEGLSNEFSELALSLEDIELQHPIVDLTLSAELDQSTPPRKSAIGTTGAYSPVHLIAKSGGKNHGWTAFLEIDGERLDYDHRGYNVVVVGGKTGEVKSTRLFDFYINKDQNQEMQKYFQQLPKFYEDGVPPIVSISVKTEGSHNVDKQIMAEVLQSIGGSGNPPAAFESFVLIGVHGAKPGTAIESTGARFIAEEVGDPADSGANLIEVADISF